MVLLYSKNDKDLAYAGNGYWKYKNRWSYQWAWECVRRSPDFLAIQPKAKAVLDRVVAENSDPENPREGLLPYWEEFSQTKEYKVLKKFGLIYPEDPKKRGKDVSAEIWAPECFLNIIPIFDSTENVLTVDQEHTFAVLFDLRRPVDFQVEETRKLLEDLGCATHSTHILPQNLQNHLHTYDQYTALQRDLGHEPKDYELSAALFPDEWPEIECQLDQHDSALLNEFGNKSHYPLDKAKSLVEKKGYLKLLRWRPDPDSFENPKPKKREKPTKKK